MKSTSAVSLRDENCISCYRFFKRRKQNLMQLKTKAASHAAVSLRNESSSLCCRLLETKAASFAAVSFGDEFSISFCRSSKRRKRHLPPPSLSETKAPSHAAESHAAVSLYKTKAASHASKRQKRNLLPPFLLETKTASHATVSLSLRRKRNLMQLRHKSGISCCRFF